MQFKLLTIATAVLSVSSAHAAAPSAGDVIGNLNKLTKLSTDTKNLASGLNVLNLITRGPKILGNFGSILGLASNGADDLDGVDVDFVDADQLDICNAVDGFTSAQQGLLSALTAKAGVLGSTPFTAPLAAVLGAIASVVEGLLSAIIGLVPTCADDATADKDALGGGLADLIDLFS